MDFPEQGACVRCGHREYRGGVRNDEPTVGPDGFNWKRLEAKAKRDLAVFADAWKGVV